MKSDGSASLLGIKKGKSVKYCQKQTKNMIFFARANGSFFGAIYSNHEQITYVALFYRATRAIRSFVMTHERPERIAHGRSFVKTFFKEL